MKSEDFLFVYGSLLKALNHQEHYILETNARFIGNGYFQGRMFSAGPYPVVVSSKLPSDIINGEVYCLSNAPRVFVRLDAYEGYDPCNEINSLFLRKRRKITLNDQGMVVDAWIYLFNRSTRYLKQIPSGDYLQFIEKEV